MQTLRSPFSAATFTSYGRHGPRELATQTFLRASSDDGNTFAPQVNLTNSTTAVRNPHIAVVGSNVYVAWQQKRPDAFNLETTFARSIDNGATFGAAQTLSNTSAIQSVEDIHVAASGDNVYVTWTRSDGSNPQLRLARSTTGGASFGAGVQVSNHPDGVYDPQMAADGDNVYVAWRGWDVPADTDQVYFQASTNEGGSFSSAQDLSSNSGEVCCVGALSLAAAGGKVYVAWGNGASGGGSEIYVSQGTAGALGGKQNVSNSTASSQRPHIVAAGDNGYVIWEQLGTSSTYELYLAVDTGAGFGSGSTISTGAVSPFSPRIAASRSDVFVAWSGPGPDGFNLFFRRGRANGGSLDSVLNLGRITSSSGQRAQLAALGTRVYVVWEDRDPSTSDVQVLLRAASMGERLPVVFVPGIAASHLIDRANNDKELWLGPLANHFDLSRFGTDNPSAHTILADRVLLSELGGVFDDAIVYKPFLDFLKNNGYREYNVFEGGTYKPEYRTEVGCNEGQTVDGEPPNLFVFAYDWRLDNAKSAEKLLDFIGCVQKYYPSTDVDIVAHSMGGLVARRYILDNVDDHKVNAFISIGSPFLGAPKLLYVLESGDFGLPGAVILKSTLKAIIGSFPGAHQLLPSAKYAQLTGLVPLAEGDWDFCPLDGGIGDVTYEEMIQAVDIHYAEQGFKPGEHGTAFHTTDQDDWSSDSTGIKYYHIVGVQDGLTTMRGVIAKHESVCTLGFSCSVVPVLKPVFTQGDGTVPLVSAERKAGGSDLNAPDAIVATFTALAPSQNDSVEHTGLTKNSLVQTSVLIFLDQSVPPATSAASASAAVAVQAASPHPYHYVTIVGPQSLLVSDGSGNDTGPIPGSTLSGSVPGVQTFTLADNVHMVLVPEGTAETFNLDFNTTGPVSIEVITGDGGPPDAAIRYRDVVLPGTTAVRLTILPAGVDDLVYDLDGDGTFESTAAPTVDVSGTAAGDIEPPVITVQEDVQGGTSRITLLAEDPGSGVAKFLYSLDGTNYQEYTGPLTLVSQRTPVLYAFADDNLANRATLVHPLRKNAAPIPAMTWWGLVGLGMLIALVVGLGLIRLRRFRQPVTLR